MSKEAHNWRTTTEAQMNVSGPDSWAVAVTTNPRNKPFPTSDLSRSAETYGLSRAICESKGSLCAHLREVAHLRTNLIAVY